MSCIVLYCIVSWAFRIHAWTSMPPATACKPINWSSRLSCTVLYCTVQHVVHTVHAVLCWCMADRLHRFLATLNVKANPEYKIGQGRYQQRDEQESTGAISESRRARRMQTAASSSSSANWQPNEWWNYGQWRAEWGRSWASTDVWLEKNQKWSRMRPLSGRQAASQKNVANKRLGWPRGCTLRRWLAGRLMEEPIVCGAVHRSFSLSPRSCTPNGWWPLCISFLDGLLQLVLSCEALGCPDGDPLYNLTGCKPIRGIVTRCDSVWLLVAGYWRQQPLCIGSKSRTLPKHIHV